MHWFGIDRRFKKQIIRHFQPLYWDDNRLITCISDLREILYGNDRPNSEEMETADPEEDLFWTCMKKINDYLKEKKGCNEMRWIDSQA